MQMMRIKIPAACRSTRAAALACYVFRYLRIKAAYQCVSYQLVVGFSRRENLATSGGGPGFSVGSIQPGKVQLSGGAEWLEARVGKRFPRHWGRRSLANLSCRTFLSVAVVRRRS